MIKKKSSMKKCCTVSFKNLFWTLNGVFSYNSKFHYNYRKSLEILKKKF